MCPSFPNCNGVPEPGSHKPGKTDVPCGSPGGAACQTGSAPEPVYPVPPGDNPSPIFLALPPPPPPPVERTPRVIVPHQASIGVASLDCASPRELDYGACPGQVKDIIQGLRETHISGWQLLLMTGLMLIPGPGEVADGIDAAGTGATAASEDGGIAASNSAGTGASRFAGTAVRGADGTWRITLGGEGGFEPGVSALSSAAQFAEEADPTVMRVLAENFQDTADSIEQVSTAAHDITPYAPVIPSAVAGSGLTGGMLLWTLGQWIAGRVGG
jgi:hypothetical protein